MHRAKKLQPQFFGAYRKVVEKLHEQSEMERKNTSQIITI